MIFSFHVPWSIACCLAAMTMVAGGYDLATRRIPNWLTASGAALGLGFNVLLYGVVGLRLSAMGLTIAFGVYMLLYILRAMGAGDVKLMAAVGAFVGPAEWFTVFMISSILGAAAATVLALRRRCLGAALSNVGFIASELLHGRAPYVRRPQLDLENEKAVTLPHGAVIAAAVMLALVLGARS